MSLRRDYILRPELTVWQDPDLFCLNTDTALLAEFMKIRPGESVLDIGTNNAALLRAADEFSPGSLTGVEICPQALEAAGKTAEGIQAPCELIEGDIRTLKHEPVDVILSNPPFFELPARGIQDPTPRETGRFEVSLNLQELVQAAARLLKSRGRFYLVYRPSRLNELMDALHANRFSVRRMAVAYDSRTKQARSLLLEAVLEGNTQTVLEPAVWI